MATRTSLPKRSLVVVCTAAVLGVGPTTAWAQVPSPSPANACDWEWGGVVEPTPYACNVPRDVNIGDHLSGNLVLGAGLTVFLLAALVVMRFARNG